MDAIVSVTREWAIGREGHLLVANRADMRRFVELTRGGTVLMGRKTYESFPKGPLKGRRNVVLTRDASYVPPNMPPELPKDTTLVTVHSIEEARSVVGQDERVWLIGGESLYHALLSCCERAYVTKNDVSVPDADAFFPNLDADGGWRVERAEPGGVTEAGVPFSFVTYERAAG